MVVSAFCKVFGKIENCSRQIPASYVRVTGHNNLKNYYSL